MEYIQTFQTGGSKMAEGHSSFLVINEAIMTLQA